MVLEGEMLPSILQTPLGSSRYACSRSFPDRLQPCKKEPLTAAGPVRGSEKFRVHAQGGKNGRTLWFGNGQRGEWFPIGHNPFELLSYLLQHLSLPRLAMRLFRSTWGRSVHSQEGTVSD